MMPTGKVRSMSVPPPSVGDRSPVDVKKAVSVPDLRGTLTTQAGIVPLRLTEPLNVPRPDSGMPQARTGRPQLSDYHAEPVPPFDSGQGAQGGGPQPENRATGTTGTHPVILLESGRISPGPKINDLPPKDAEPKPPSATGHSEPVPPSVEAKRQKTKKKPRTQGGQQASASAASKGASPQERSELVAEVKRLVTEATPNQLKAAGGDLMKLAGIDESPYKASLASDSQLLKTFRTDFNRSTKGGQEFPPGFNDKLLKSFESSVEKLQKTKSSQATASAKPVGKLTIDQMPGLQDMFVARAVNHLITGELHCLDPMIGDEGCQIRTPFVLDMHRLIQERMPKNAADLVRHYRDKTGSEQTRVLEQLNSLEVKRKNQDKTYESDVSDFVKSNPLEESMSANSGEYEAMLSDLTTAIEKQHPAAIEYLNHVCSEGSIYWEDVLDPFGLSMLTDRHPVFPNTMLAGRKMKQSKLSKDYLVKSAAELVREDGGIVSVEKRDIGFDKKGAVQTSPSFLTAQSKKDRMPAMLLHALQIHSGAAVTKGKRQLELSPYWETTRLALTHALKEGYPLIVNLRRLTVSGEGNDRQYSGNICKTLFYEPTAEGYRYQPDPSTEQQSQGALLFQGYSMLREGDTNIPGATLPIAPWVFKEDPKEFLDGFTKCDVANLMLLGDVGTHHPLNTGDGSFAYGSPDGQAGVYSFENDPGGRKYVDTIHDQTLSDMGATRMTQKGQEYLVGPEKPCFRPPLRLPAARTVRRMRPGAATKPPGVSLFRDKKA